MIFGRGERIASLEAKVDGVHQDLHMLSAQVEGMSRSVGDLRTEVQQSALRRPSWAVATLLTLLTGFCMALLAAVLTFALT